ncbi:MAG TPA: glycoside hydrolase family 28 protein [Verrucomicrobiae bacterium]
MKTAAVIFLSLALPLCAATFNVREFGATGDGKTLDTAAIQKALDTCETSGGTVEFPPGTYLSRPIFLRSRTTLRLEAGAVLKATDERADFADPNRSRGFVAFINGTGLTNVTITGSGTIDGSGGKWWIPAEAAREQKSGTTLPRPRMIIFTRCTSLRLENVTLQNSPSFHLVPVDCTDVVISNVTILAPERAPNTDAIDPSACKNLLITHCRIDVGDDNVALKAGHQVAGREFACDHITVSDCTFMHGHGMSIGSETSGGVRNLLVTNCTFNGTDSGIRIKTSREKGGLVENLIYTHLTMTNVGVPINLTCYYPKIPATDTPQPVTATTPIFRNILISHVTSVNERSAGFIVGLPESCITNVVLEIVRLSAQTGLTIRNARGIRFQNSAVGVKKGSRLILENAQVEGLENASN